MRRETLYTILVGVGLIIGGITVVWYVSTLPAYCDTWHYTHDYKRVVLGIFGFALIFVGATALLSIPVGYWVEHGGEEDEETWEEYVPVGEP